MQEERRRRKKRRGRRARRREARNTMAVDELRRAKREDWREVWREVERRLLNAVLVRGMSSFVLRLVGDILMGFER
jgi:hypothetical protein